LPPTLLDAAGIEVPASLPGHSLIPLAADPEASVRDEVLVQISEAGRGRAIRTPDWTYCAMLDPADGDPDLLHEAYCYDNRNDPAQRTNLAGDPANRTAREALRERLIAVVRREEGREIRVREKNG
ncbi:MAG: arylsulfatase, partial [Clostridiales bacterium]|nr:arylsulfatase [Clostridiales bacterium]